MSARRPQRPPLVWGRRFWLVLTVGAAAVLAFSPVADYDFFWHLANGRAMVESGAIVGAELFSYTAPGRTFHNHEWLSQIIFYLLWVKTGTLGLVVLESAITGVLAFLLFGTARSIGAPPAASACIVLAAVLAAEGRLTVRPQLFSLLGLGLQAWVLFGWLKGRRRAGALLLLPPLMAVWDLLHGAVYGFIFLHAFVLGAVLQTVRRRKWPRQARDAHGTPVGDRPLKPLLGAYGVSVAVMAVNPYGLSAYATFADFASRASFAHLIEEFQPSRVALDAAFYWAMVAVACVLVFAFPRRFHLTAFLVALPFAVLSVRYMRAQGAFALATVPLLAHYAAACREACRNEASGRAARRKAARAGAAALAVGLGLYVGYHKLLQPEHDRSFGHALLDKYFPVATARFIEAEGVRGNMYNDGHFGGYLAYTLYPERRIFMYNHHVLFRDIPPLLHSLDYLDRFNVTYAVVNDAFVMGRLLQYGWVAVYWEPSAALLLRDVPQNRALIDRYRLVYFRPLTTPAALDMHASDPVRAAAVARELSAHLKYRRDDRVAEKLAEFATTLTDPLEARRYLRDALGHNAASAHLWAALGTASYNAKDAAAAERSFRRALELGADRPETYATAGYTAYDLGDFGAAAERFRRALERRAGYPPAHFGLGIASMRLGRLADARHHFSVFLEQVPTGPWADKARAHLRGLGRSGAAGP